MHTSSSNVGIYPWLQKFLSKRVTARSQLALPMRQLVSKCSQLETLPECQQYIIFPCGLHLISLNLMVLSGFLAIFPCALIHISKPNCLKSKLQLLHHQKRPSQKSTDLMASLSSYVSPLFLLYQPPWCYASLIWTHGSNDDLFLEGWIQAMESKETWPRPSLCYFSGQVEENQYSYNWVFFHHTRIIHPCAPQHLQRRTFLYCGNLCLLDNVLGSSSPQRLLGWYWQVLWSCNSSQLFSQMRCGIWNPSWRYFSSRKPYLGYHTVCITILWVST